MSKPSLTNCPKLASVSAARDVAAKSSYKKSKLQEKEVKTKEKKDQIRLLNRLKSCPTDILVVIALGITSSHSEQRS